MLGLPNRRRGDGRNWLGTWLGVFPTWETLGAQVAAFAFVIGSYFAAEYVRVKRPRRRAAATRRSAPADVTAPAETTARGEAMAPEEVPSGATR